MNIETLVLLVFHAVLAPATGLHALLYKRDPRSSFGWIAVCLLFPVAGPVLYVFFGVNRVRGKAQRFRLTKFSTDYHRGVVVERESPVPEEIAPQYRNLACLGRSLSRHPLVGGNEVEPLSNGEEAFPAMLEAIVSARSHVFLSTYLFIPDQTGKRFEAALSGAVARGVEVRVLIDGVGDYYSFPRMSFHLRRRGVKTARFLPPRLLPPSFSINMRNHGKILMVDDEIAFTGGINIADRHCLKLEPNRRLSADRHFRVRGPVLSQLRAEFLRSWTFSTGETDVPLERTEYEDVGALVCRTITDGPDEDLDRLALLLNAAIAAARESIHVMTPYFLPPREIIGALQAAAIRGVKVIIVLPVVNNLPFVHWATRNMLWQLLLRGVEVHYQPPPFHHGKLFVVDGYYTLIGSTNWDPRSLRLNFELQVEVYGSHFARANVEHIEAGARAGRPVTLDEVDGRSLPLRFRDSLCWLFSPYL